MHPLVKKIKQTIEAQRLLTAGDRCVVGVSGGPDSMALLHLLVELAKELDISLIVAHADHGLRPAEAAAEAALVRAAAERLDCPCFFLALAVKSFAGEQGLSIEHAARILRYGFFAEVAEGQGARKIAVAHTADDQAEEILLRLIRGTGRAGLAGMEPLRAGRVIRPLLGIGKEELLNYLAARKIAYCLDSSNQERIYLRNRIRLDLLPYLKERFNPNIGASLRQTAAIFSAEEELLAALTDKAYEAVVAGRTEDPPAATLDLPSFMDQPLALQRRILEKVCWQMECRPSFIQIGQLLQLAVAGREGGCAHLAMGLRVIRQGGRLCFSYPQGKISVRGDLLAQQTAAFSVDVLGPGEYPLAVVGKLIVVEELSFLPVDWQRHSLEVQYLDGDAIVFPLLLRPFRPGDRFKPQGAPGHKKVGDFFTDHKVPVLLRRQIPILADAEGIVALVGLRADARCAATKDSRRVLAVRVQAL